MPRGSTEGAAERAKAELQAEYGDSGRPIGNVAALIDAHMASRDPEVDRLAALPLRDEHTAALDLDAIEAPDNGFVVDAVVRGDGISFVYADRNGKLHHGAVPFTGESWEETSEPAARLHATRRLQDASVAAEVQAERQRLIDEATAEIDAKLGKKLAQDVADRAEKGPAMPKRGKAPAASSPGRRQGPSQAAAAANAASKEEGGDSE